MRITAFVVVFFVAVFVAAIDTSKAEALSPPDYFEQPSGLFIDYDLYSKQNQEESEDKPEEVEPEFEQVEKMSKPSKPKVVRHSVKSGDTLTAIANKYNVSWKRIYYKNKHIKDPHMLKPGQKLAIPKPGEKLKKRQIKTTVVQSQPTTTSVSTPQTATTTLVRGNSSGNTYYYGYCTWYAKSRRSDLPNNLGNADTWVARAAAQGFSTGSTPRVGAVAQARYGMHVAYVEKVHANGNVTVSEMNYQGWGVVSSRVAPASEFLYIY